ncbi:HAD family hydrolase [Flagellimonas allohymeniacidonis]|uniref:HAD family phosphatase n=1 Tax=Flagellimonas allohymeniacidonis TaxID=2517819 RepID=A0A4Q8QDZ0_9FLAO|nr:HAD family hydrolase [Allomuricauda hymeniacidonis]TAI46683.1 HAD family phosphatase [Allomuricauda hymeniacidonis]
MNPSKIKMVVTDMDGTLLNSNHQVSDRFFELFHELSKKGIQFVAASGRQYHSIVEKLKPIKEQIYVIAENGALVKKQEEELLVIPLQHHLKTKLLDTIDQIDGAHAMLCGKYSAYFDGSSTSFFDEIKEYYEKFEIHDDLSHVSDEIIKIAVYHKLSAENYIYPELKKIEEQVKVKVSGMHWVDLNHIDANKGFALDKLLADTGVGKDEVMVFGDYNNDLEMMQLVEHSFAMQNAHPTIQEAAKYQTASNDDFGVERVLETLL